MPEEWVSLSSHPSLLRNPSTNSSADRWGAPIGRAAAANAALLIGSTHCTAAAGMALKPGRLARAGVVPPGSARQLRAGAGAKQKICWACWRSAHIPGIWHGIAYSSLHQGSTSSGGCTKCLRRAVSLGLHAQPTLCVTAGLPKPP
jgi:hypothetical protein